MHPNMKMSDRFDVLDRLIRFEILLFAINPLINGDAAFYMYISVSFVVAALIVIMAISYNKKEKESWFLKMLDSWQSTVDDAVVLALGGFISITADDTPMAIMWFSAMGLMLICLILKIIRQR